MMVFPPCEAISTTGTYQPPVESGSPSGRLAENGDPRSGITIALLAPSVPVADDSEISTLGSMGSTFPSLSMVGMQSGFTPRPDEITGDSAQRYQSNLIPVT